MDFDLQNKFLMSAHSLNTCGNPHCPQKRNDNREHKQLASSVAGPSSPPPEIRAPMLQQQICCTDSLLELYNSTADGSTKRKMLARFLYLYGTVFENLMPWDKAELAEEFAKQADIEVRSLWDKELVYSMLKKLLEALESRYAKEPFAMALSGILLRLDVSFFDGDSSELFEVAEHLIQTLQLCKIHNRKTFQRYRPILAALYQTCTLIHQITPQLPLSYRLKEDQARMLEGLKIFEESLYYPFLFYKRLLEQSISRFTEGRDVSALSSITKRFATGVIGLLYLYNGFRFINPTPFTEGVKKLKAACADGSLQRKPWFDWLQALSFAAVLCLSDPLKLELFRNCLEQILEYQKTCLHDAEVRKAVRYGIIHEVTGTAVLAESEKVRRRAMIELLKLALRRTLSEGWDEDPEVYEGLLDAASMIYQRGRFRSVMKAALVRLTSSTKDDLQETICSWLGNESLDEKLRTLRGTDHRCVLHNHGTLFQRAYKELKSLSSREGFCLTIAPVHLQPSGAADIIREPSLRFNESSDEDSQVNTLQSSKEMDPLELLCSHNTSVLVSVLNEITRSDEHNSVLLGESSSEEDSVETDHPFEDEDIGNIQYTSNADVTRGEESIDQSVELFSRNEFSEGASQSANRFCDCSRHLDVRILPQRNAKQDYFILILKTCPCPHTVAHVLGVSIRVGNEDFNELDFVEEETESLNTKITVSLGTSVLDFKRLPPFRPPRGYCALSIRMKVLIRVELRNNSISVQELTKTLYWKIFTERPQSRRRTWKLSLGIFGLASRV